MKKLIIGIALLLFPLYTFAFDWKFVSAEEMQILSKSPTAYGLTITDTNGSDIKETVYVTSGHPNQTRAMRHEPFHVLYNHLPTWKTWWWKLEFDDGKIPCITTYCKKSAEETFAEKGADLLEYGECFDGYCEWIRTQMGLYPLDWPVDNQLTIEPKEVVNAPKTVVNKVPRKLHKVLNKKRPVRASTR